MLLRPETFSDWSVKCRIQRRNIISLWARKPMFVSILCWKKRDRGMYVSFDWSNGVRTRKGCLRLQSFCAPVAYMRRNKPVVQLSWNLEDKAIKNKEGPRTCRVVIRFISIISLLHKQYKAVLWQVWTKSCSWNNILGKISIFSFWFPHNSLSFALLFFTRQRPSRTAIEFSADLPHHQSSWHVFGIIILHKLMAPDLLCDSDLHTCCGFK